MSETTAVYEIAFNYEPIVTALAKRKCEMTHGVECLNVPDMLPCLVCQARVAYRKSQRIADAAKQRQQMGQEAG